jgi:hypothetical protein
MESTVDFDYILVASDHRVGCVGPRPENARLWRWIAVVMASSQ